MPRNSVYYQESTIDRAAHLRTEKVAAGGGQCVLVHQGSILLRRSAEGLELAWCDRTLLSEPSDYVAYLGRWQNEDRFGVSVSSDALPDNHEWHDLRSAAFHLDSESVALGGYARALALWQANHRHCGRCGEVTEITQGGFCRECPACGQQTFPRVDPAIIVAVEKDGRLLLGRQPSWPENRYSVIAGFVEPGETLEGAVRREVAEETGVAIEHIEYFSSQPWPFPGSIMVGFTASATSSEIVLDDELEDAAWYSLADIDAQVASGQLILPTTISISRRLVDDWMARERERLAS